MPRAAARYCCSVQWCAATGACLEGVLKRILSLMTAATLPVAFFPGCTKEEDTCASWLDQFQRHKKEKQAIEKMAELQCTDAAPTLDAAWSDSLYQRELLDTAQKLGPNEGTLNLVRRALTEVEFAPIALPILIQWKVPDLQQIVTSVVQSPKLVAARHQGVEALITHCLKKADGTIDSGAIDTLIWVAGQDATNQGLETNNLALKQLEALPWSTLPTDKATAAAQSFLRALYLQDGRGGSVQMTARLALRAIGDAAIEPLLAAYSGDDKDLMEFAEVRGIPRWRFTSGHELVELLWDLGSAKATKPLIASIGISLEAPPDVARLDEEQQTEWIRANQNRLATIALVAGALPSDEAVNTAVEILSRKEIPLDAAQFINAGLALGLTGSKASQDALWTFFRTGDDLLAPKRLRTAELRTLVEAEKDLIKRTELSTEHDKIVDEIAVAETEKSRWVKSLAVALDVAALDAFKLEILDVEKGPLQSAGREALARGYFDAVTECKSDPACYTKIIVDMKGQLSAIPEGIVKAGEGKDEGKKKLIDETKPITASITAKEDELGKKSELLTRMRTDFDEAKKSPAKLKELGKKTIQEVADAYNAELEAFTLGKTELKALFESRNAVIARLEPLDDALVGAQAKLHRLEKASMMLGRYPEHRAEAVKAIIGVFGEPLSAEHQGYFQQFRQWSLITLDRIATKDDIPLLEMLRSVENKEGQAVTYSSIRLGALITRLKRAP